MGWDIYAAGFVWSYRVGMRPMGSLRLLLSAVPVFNEFCYMLIATSCCSQLHRIRRYPISAVAMSRRVGLTV